MTDALHHLQQLESLRFDFEPSAAEQKRTCLKALKAAQLRTAEQVLRLHEILCFMQAWPDDDAILSLVDSLLSRFDRRRDLKRWADELINSGVAGTAIHFRFYAATARWLADRWPIQLHIDWEDFENSAILEGYLPLLASYSETPGLDAIPMELPDWIERLKGRQESDAQFVIGRLAAMIPDSFLHEQLYDALDIPVQLAPGSGVPNRTHAKYEKSTISYQTSPFHRTRPVVGEEIHRLGSPPKLLRRAEGLRLVDLAHAAMVTRQRDLDAFANADPHDVSLLDDEDGLQFVLYGVVPERRFLLETLYGYVVLKNGVPISYGAVTCLFGSAEVAYTIFDTFRGGESARIFVRTLAMVRQVFGCDTFMIDPYQLGAENEDALQSGAWWFYQKLGFRPRDKKLLKLMQHELAAMKRQPRHRSSLAVLKQLSSENLYLDLNPPREDVMGMLDFAEVGLQITDLFADRFGAGREEGEKTLAAEAADRLPVDSFQGWTAHEKLAWRRWSPLVALLGDVDHWPSADQEALVRLIRAKGGRQELDYLHGFDGLGRLRTAILKLSQK